MQHTTRHQGSTTQHTSALFAAGLHFFASLLKWLAGLFQLTDQEQEDAGIYLSDHDDA